MTIYMIASNNCSDTYRDIWEDPQPQEEYGYFTDKAVAEAKVEALNGYIRVQYDNSARQATLHNEAVVKKNELIAQQNAALKVAGLPESLQMAFTPTPVPSYKEWWNRTSPSYSSVITIELSKEQS